MKSAYDGEDEIVKAIFQSGVFLSLLLITGGAFSDSSAVILKTDNWSSEIAEAQRSNVPIMILFTRKHCTYCERLKAEVLEPRLKRGEFGSVALIREFDIDRGGKIRDFDGEKIRTRIFIKRYNIYATPSVVVVDYQGKPISTPIVGFDNPEDYMGHLEFSINVPNWESREPEFAATGASGR